MNLAKQTRNRFALEGWGIDERCQDVDRFGAEMTTCTADGTARWGVPGNVIAGLSGGRRATDQLIYRKRVTR